MADYTKGERDFVENADSTSSSVTQHNAESPHQHHVQTMERDPTLTLISQPTLEEHGPGIDHHIPQADVKPSNPQLAWPRLRAYLQEPFCEFWGVFIIIMFGDGVVAQVTLSNGAKGNYQSISWGWGQVISCPFEAIMLIW